MPEYDDEQWIGERIKPRFCQRRREHDREEM